MVVHLGSSTSCGHYISYVKTNNKWFKCDDEEVREVDKKVVTDQQAYLLFYRQRGEKHRKNEGVKAVNSQITQVVKQHTQIEVVKQQVNVQGKDQVKEQVKIKIEEKLAIQEVPVQKIEQKMKQF
jgi:hypothetical protein